MPVDAILAVPTLGRSRTAWCEVRADCRDWLATYGLVSAREFLALPGVVVSGHVGRNVSRVQIGSRTAYLKREHRVRIRDRFRAWRAGFGWVSVSAREAMVLRHLAAHRLPGPEWLAYGEADGQGFLLVEAASGTELRRPSKIGPELTERLGRVVARLHAAGIDQPDLFAKHFLIDDATDRVTILDWQRATICKAVSWKNRIRGLAALRATICAEVMDSACWDRLLRAYLAEVPCEGPGAGVGRLSRAVRPDGSGEPSYGSIDRLTPRRSSSQPLTPAPLPRFGGEGFLASTSHSPGAGSAWDLVALRRTIDRAAIVLAQHPGIRSQRTIGRGVTQELIRIGGETVCAIPSVAQAFRDPAAIADVYAGTIPQLPVTRADLRASRYRLPFGRWWAALRGKVWRSPELRAARLLFHLERHGIPAPTLLAYGQRFSRLTSARAFLLSTTVDARSPRPGDEGDWEKARQLLTRLHDAGCLLRNLGNSGEPFGIAGEAAVITDVYRLRLVRRPGARQIRRDFARLDAYFRGGR
jgi:tRNA A-37 threonylcarbamoyl transferase component Bud32